jgi:ribosomal protein S19E (S16A)
VLSPEGQKLLTKAARDVMEELAAKQPSLKKYL